MEKRLDIILFEKGLYSSREKAKNAILSSRVKVNGKIVTKPAQKFSEYENFEIEEFEFVSRGGNKLQGALESFNISLKGKTVLDIGASTGGFTDVCLKNGAKKVIAIDTGTDQLAPTLKNDARVESHEKTNYLTFNASSLGIDFVVIDVSFVSLTLLIPKLDKDFEHVEIVALIKPQFECGKEYAKKHHGIVKDEKMHKKVVNLIENCFKNHNFCVLGVITSCIKGGDGNTEFLIYIKK